MAIIFQNPRTSVIGEDALKNSAKYMIEYGKKAFIVTGKHVAKTSILTELTDFLSECDIEYFIFDGISGEPTDIMITEGRKLFESCECDFIIGVGGGSPIDSAKAIAIPSGESLSFYMGKEIAGDIAKVVAIPTTAGTGSEATKFTIITDVNSQVKMLLKGDALIPDLAIIDPKYCVSAPRSVTINTALDALTHAIESYLSIKANDMTNMFALKAIALIFEYLPKVLEDEANLEYRSKLSLASYQAGIAINNASVTLVHGMSRPIGALFHVPHGLSNAMLLEECLNYVALELKKDFKTLGKTIGSRDFMGDLHELIELCELPTLEEQGISQDTFAKSIEKMATDAMISGSPSNSKADVDKEILISIYQGYLYKQTAA